MSDNSAFLSRVGAHVVVAVMLVIRLFHVCIVPCVYVSARAPWCSPGFRPQHVCTYGGDYRSSLGHINDAQKGCSCHVLELAGTQGPELVSACPRSVSFVRTRRCGLSV